MGEDLPRLRRKKGDEVVVELDLFDLVHNDAAAVVSEVERDPMFARDAEYPRLFSQSLGPAQDGLQRFACHGPDRPRDTPCRQAPVRTGRVRFARRRPPLRARAAWQRAFGLVCTLMLGLWTTACVHPSAARGRRALDDRAFGIASKELERAVREEPQELSYWVDLGRAYVGEGRGAEAVRAFEGASALAPREARLKIYLGHAQELSRQYDSAEAAYRSAISLEPQRAWTHRVLGTRLLRWGRAEEAIAPLQRATELDPKHAETHHALAIALAESGDPRAAEGTLRTAVAQFPDERSLWLGLAALVVNRGAYEEALSIYAEVLARSPDFAPAWVGRALLLAQLGRLSEAELELDRAVQLDPNNQVYRERLRLAAHKPR